MTLDWTFCRTVPYAFQREGIISLVKWDDTSTGRLYGGCFALLDEMGTGKSKQTIDAAQFLFRQQEIDRVLIVAPASVRAVWADPELGEIQKHAWDSIAHRITSLHKKHVSWTTGLKELPAGRSRLEWMVTNYEFVRKPERLKTILSYCSRKTLLVLDESSAVKTARALQTRACLTLRGRCQRIVELNGTPIANNPGDLYAQAMLLDPRILGCKNYFHFRAKYARMGGYLNKQIVSWHNLEDLQSRMKPYVLRRLTEDVLELPKKHDSVSIPVPLTERTWKYYTEMRDDMVAWLNSNTMSVAAQAGVKAMRLSQITSGFIGGIDSLPLGISIDSTEDEVDPEGAKITGETAEIGSEKLDFYLNWLYERMTAHQWNHKILTWSRFRPEVFRVLAALPSVRRDMHIGCIMGGQKPDERRHALKLLDPRTTPEGPVVVVGTPASGSMGLNCTAAWTMVYLSNDFNLKTRLQSMARIHRSGQTHACEYFDFVGVGPKGQKTLDHRVLKALAEKENLATWTSAAWRAALLEQ